MATKEKHGLPRGAFVSEGQGQCGTCLGVITHGELFYWRQARPECNRCREKRLKHDKLNREIKGR